MTAPTPNVPNHQTALQRVVDNLRYNWPATLAAIAGVAVLWVAQRQLTVDGPGWASVIVAICAAFGALHLAKSIWYRVDPFAWPSKREQRRQTAD